MIRSRLVFTAGLVVALATGTATSAFAQPAAASAVLAQAQPTPLHRVMRGEHASDRSLRRVRRRLERMIDSLQHDRHDYAGHRVAAIQALQNARAELMQAEQTPEAQAH